MVATVISGLPKFTTSHWIFLDWSSLELSPVWQVAINMINRVNGPLYHIHM